MGVAWGWLVGRNRLAINTLGGGLQVAWGGFVRLFWARSATFRRRNMLNCNVLHGVQNPRTKSRTRTLKARAIFTRLSTVGDSTPRSIRLMNTVERSAFSANFS
jgi:hypothetical protein